MLNYYFIMLKKQRKGNLKNTVISLFAFLKKAKSIDTFDLLNCRQPFHTCMKTWQQHCWQQAVQE